MISHPEFGPQTTTTEAAKAFAEHIRGKTSELIDSIHLFLFWPLYLSWLGCEKNVRFYMFQVNLYFGRRWVLD
jgi:hypothetical protein